MVKYPKMDLFDCTVNSSPFLTSIIKELDAFSKLSVVYADRLFLEK